MRTFGLSFSSPDDWVRSGYGQSASSKFVTSIYRTSHAPDARLVRGQIAARFHHGLGAMALVLGGVLATGSGRRYPEEGPVHRVGQSAS
jgi:hypothetical protein